MLPIQAIPHTHASHMHIFLLYHRHTEHRGTDRAVCQETNSQARDAHTTKTRGLNLLQSTGSGFAGCGGRGAARARDGVAEEGTQSQSPYKNEERKRGS